MDYQGRLQSLENLPGRPQLLPMTGKAEFLDRSWERAEISKKEPNPMTKQDMIDLLIIHDTTEAISSVFGEIGEVLDMSGKL